MALIIDDITFSYHKKDSHPLLRNINMEIQPGNLYGFLGRNGSGKTTLLKVVNGLLTPQQGRVYIEKNGGEIDVLHGSRREISKEIGFVPQDHKGAFPYPVIEMVVMGRNPHLDFFSRPKEEDYEIARNALESIGIMYLMDKDFTEISGGERQLVLIARVIAQGAKYLILDEPTSHLDFKNQYQILKHVKRICKENNVAAIMSMHDPNLAVSFADYIYMLKDGEILTKGSTSDIMTKDNLSALYNFDITIHQTKDNRPFILAETE